MPVYTLTTMDPLEETIELIKKHLASSSKNLCKPEKSGIGIGVLQDISDTFATKRWWNLRTKDFIYVAFYKLKTTT
ncbi:hypothetical protein H5410_006806 [Solanum commersonii]|uniref:Uncharacterized protein n=1 Tax=Solanum commersonii TaxID=4109 RepID=A0A9J6AB97_SOLCO|nr:hypothetical protein H5410_006806 [Solanum commersonii]